jgi:hypothetical protein
MLARGGNADVGRAQGVDLLSSGTLRLIRPFTSRFSRTANRTKKKSIKPIIHLFCVFAWPNN